jgi:gliding motility-associated lipoprotein GldD
MPKPKAQLRLEYPTPTYKTSNFKYFSFEKSDFAKIKIINNQKLNLEYPKMKAKIYLTYNKINNNLTELLKDAEKFTFEHTIKADEIITQDFINKNDSVYATMNNITGNTASQIQFHITDSTHHFINGSLYFYVQPNYDSIMPAIDYIKQDISHLLETFKWNH